MSLLILFGSTQSAVPRIMNSFRISLEYWWQVDKKQTWNFIVAINFCGNIFKFALAPGEKLKSGKEVVFEEKAVENLHTNPYS